MTPVPQKMIDWLRKKSGPYNYLSLDNCPAAQYQLEVNGVTFADGIRGGSGHGSDPAVLDRYYEEPFGGHENYIRVTNATGAFTPNRDWTFEAALIRALEINDEIASPVEIARELEPV